MDGETHMQTPQYLISCCVFFISAILAGCYGSTERLSEQVIAKVDGVEITSHQLDLAQQQLSRQLTKTEREQARKKLQKQLIDRQLAVQQALKLGLERNPELMLQLQEQRLDTLARAYAAQLGAELPTPTAPAINAFYLEHPALFAERKIYRFKELSLDTVSAQASELRQRLAANESGASIAVWLADNNAKFQWQSGIRAAEDFPIDALKTLHANGVGRRTIFESSQTIYVYEIVDIQSAPVAKEQALQQISAYLNRQQLLTAMDKKMSQLHLLVAIEQRPMP
jgi:EpsD family peptidyl-prolyl cis-trans isomerase